MVTIICIPPRQGLGRALIFSFFPTPVICVTALCEFWVGRWSVSVFGCSTTDRYGVYVAIFSSNGRPT